MKGAYKKMYNAIQGVQGHKGDSIVHQKNELYNSLDDCVGFQPYTYMRK